MATPYKMKGSPMQRNFGISPLNDKSAAQIAYDAKIEKNAEDEYNNKSTASSVHYSKLTEKQKAIHRRNSQQ